MPTIKVNPRTWEEVKNEQRKLRLAFGTILLKEKDVTGKSLRDLEDEYGISRETVNTLIKEAKAVTL